MDPLTEVVMFLLFMIAISVNYRLGFRAGVHDGHRYAVYEMVVWMIKNDKISGTTADGYPATAKEISDRIMEELNKIRPTLTFDDVK